MRDTRYEIRDAKCGMGATREGIATDFLSLRERTEVRVNRYQT
jgi:hypothetical protein